MTRVTQKVTQNWFISILIDGKFCAASKNAVKRTQKSFCLEVMAVHKVVTLFFPCNYEHTLGWQRTC